MKHFITLILFFILAAPFGVAQDSLAPSDIDDGCGLLTLDEFLSLPTDSVTVSARAYLDTLYPDNIFEEVGSMIDRRTPCGMVIIGTGLCFLVFLILFILASLCKCIMGCCKGACRCRRDEGEKGSAEETVKEE